MIMPQCTLPVQNLGRSLGLPIVLSSIKVMQAANITKERLASFDRPIKSEPAFRPEQRQGLLTDLSNYLQTLKASLSHMFLFFVGGRAVYYKCESHMTQKNHKGYVQQAHSPASLFTALCL